MSITATELKTNLSKYHVLAAAEDIYITKNGKVICKLSNPFRDKVDTAKSLFRYSSGYDYSRRSQRGILEQSMKAIIDTCIIIDALQNRAYFGKDAQK